MYSFCQMLITLSASIKTQTIFNEPDFFKLVFYAESACKDLIMKMAESWTL